MAFAGLKVTLGQRIGDGGYNSSVSRSTDQATNIAAVQTAIDAAAANATIAGDGTALGLVNAITTALAAVTAADNADVVVRVNTSVITSATALKRAFDAAYRNALGFMAP